MGQVKFEVGDVLKFTFSISKDDDVIPVCAVQFTAGPHGLMRGNDLVLPLNTWQANTLTVPVHLTADMNYTKKFRNTISQAMRAASEVLLPSVDLELEVRSSDYIALSKKVSHLESAEIVLKFDR